ncbi:MAG: tail protein X [Myxococcales bacterium]|nr:tail protein X [Myxococcales bacterium]
MAAALALLVALSAPSFVRADVIHVYARGETFAALAERYYGNAALEPVIVAANFLYVQANPTLPPGVHLTIPSVQYLRANAGDTWERLAQRHLGDGRRGPYLARINGAVFTAPPSAGTVLRLPYLLRYVITAEEPLFEVARRFYGDRAMVQFLVEYNSLGSQRVGRGQVLIVPLHETVLRELPEGSTDAALIAAHSAQRTVDRELPTLERLLSRGLYVETVALASRLAGADPLTNTQRVAIYRCLAEAQAALDRPDLASEAYRQVLAADPEFSLDPTHAAPKLLTAFTQARGTAPSVLLAPAPPTARPDTAH